MRYIGNSSETMNEKDIQEFIRETEADLALAKDFLAMWQRRKSDTNTKTTASLAPAKASQPPLIPNGATDKQGDYGANKRAMLKAIALCPHEYTIYDVESKLTEIGSPMTREAVSQALSRLKRSNKISLHKPSAGRTPAIYRKI